MKKTILLLFFCLAGVVGGKAQTTIVYDVWCNGERFTSDNLTVACGSGTAVYNPATSTLTLTNATISVGCTIPSDIGTTYCESGIFTNTDLNIVLIGNNVIEDTGGTGIDNYGADNAANIHVSGGGTLTTTGTAPYDGYGFYTLGTITIDGVTLYINSSCTGIWTHKGLTVTNSKIVITNSQDNFFGIVVEEGDVLIDGSVLIGNKQPIDYDEINDTSFFCHRDGGRLDYLLVNGSMIITYDPEAGPYTEGADEGIISDPAGVAVWAISGSNSGIAYHNGAISGFEEIQGVTVNSAPTFVAVTDITGIATTATAGTPLALSGTVVPSDATQDIVWSIKTAGTTGASIVETQGIASLHTSAAGTVVVTATITDGTAVGTDYEQDFTITVSEPAPAFMAVTNITLSVNDATDDGKSITLSGAVAPSNATNQDIVWSIKTAGTTGASIVETQGIASLHTTSAGKVVITATIADGTAIGTDYTKDFNVTFSNVKSENVDLGKIIAVYSGTITCDSEEVRYKFNGTDATVSINGGAYTAVDAGLVSDWTDIATVADYYFAGINVTETNTTENFLGTVVEAPDCSAVISYKYVDGQAVIDVLPVEITVTHNDYEAQSVLIGTLSVPFVAVSNITGVATTATAGTPLALSGTVAPANATNSTIAWSIKDAGATGATIAGNTFSAATAGTAIVTATIADGTATGTDYTKDFTITVNTAGGTTPPTPPTPPTSYNVAVGTYDNGSITTNRATATAGATVTLTVSPATGYELDAITVRRTSSSSTTVALSGTGLTRTFAMPAFNVTVDATFAKTAAQTLWEQALAIIEAAAYNVPQSAVATEADLRVWLADYINSLLAAANIPLTVASSDIYVTSGSLAAAAANLYLKAGSFAAAAASSADGSFTFFVLPSGVTGSTLLSGTIVAHATANEQLTMNNEPLKACVADGVLYVSGVTTGQTLRVFNVMGKLIYYGIASDIETQCIASLPSRGVYIVTDGKATVKIVY